VYQAALAQQESAASGKDVPADPEVVIAADTVIVTKSGEVVEKPRSEADHRAMLRRLRDTRTHKVLTAVCVLAPRRDAKHPGYVLAEAAEETRVVFAGEADGVSDAVIDSYVRTREGADKAGGYAVQGTGGLLLVERVEGSVDNVVGLPVRRTLQLIERVCLRQEEGDEDEEESEEDE
jgi:MAF protein